VKFILFVEGETEGIAVAPFLKRWLDAELEKPVGLRGPNKNRWSVFRAQAS